MSNITIERTGNVIDVAFNDSYKENGFGIYDGGYPREYFRKVWNKGDHVLVYGVDGELWRIVSPGGNSELGLVVDSIDGAKPVSSKDLYDKILDLLV